MSKRGAIAALVALGALAAMLVPGPAGAAASATYAGAGTLVAKQSGHEPLLDDGAAVCLTQQLTPQSPNGLGGACLSFPDQGRPGAVLVQDATLGLNVAFQVCVDMNQDGHCYMKVPEEPGQVVQPDPCADVVGFSHHDGGFFNPLGYYIDPATNAVKPLPTELPPPGTCVPDPRGPLPRKPWPGYIVFLCEGVHESVTAGPHAHTPSTGTMRLVPFAQPGAGDFCQTIRDNFKEYYILP